MLKQLGHPLELLDLHVPTCKKIYSTVCMVCRSAYTLKTPLNLRKKAGSCYLFLICAFQQ